MQISNYTIQTLSLLKVDFTEYMYRIYPFSDCLPNKNYKTYCRRARVQVWTILNDFEVFEQYWIIFLFYLCLFWTTYFSDYLWSYQPTSGYPAITGYIWISWAMFISVNNFEVFWTIYNHFLVLLCSISIYLKLSLVISGSGDILGYLGLS